MRTVFESAGDVRSVDLLAALVALWREKADGSLKFSRPGATAGFDLRGGELVLSISSQPQYEAAAILSRAGKLDAAALEKLQRPAGSDASIAALQAGLITEREWRWGQKIRAIEILSDLLGWLEGDYSFDPQARPAAGEWSLTVPRLVLELFLRSRDRTLVEHYLGPSDLPLLRAKTFDEEFDTFGLTSDAGSVVALIDGRASGEEIAERAPAEEFAVLKLLAALTTLGLVHPAEAAPEPGQGAASPILPEVREPEPVAEEAPEAVREPEPEPEPERVAAPEPETEIEPGEPEREEEEAPAAPVAHLPKETEVEPAPSATEEEVTSPVESKEVPEEPESDRRMAIEPEAPSPALAQDLPREAPKPPVPMEAHLLTHEPEVPPADEPPPPDGEKPRRGIVLAALLALLVVAVVGLLIARSRRSAPDQVSDVAPRPTAQETSVFPPPETAVPLPARRATTPSPSSAATHPAATRPAAIAPTPLPTIASKPSSPPTRVPTQPPSPRPPTQTPTRVATRAESTRPPTPNPTLRQPSPAPARALPPRAPTRVPTKPEPAVPARPTAAPAAVVESRGEATRAEWIARAEQDRRSLLKRKNVRYAVQLELACEVSTLEKAWNWDKPPGTIWLLTTSYRGRTCFRVLWGRFGGLPEAREAKARVPDFFVGPGNRPIVVSVR